ncbi:DUF7389 domain-containing protein [Halorhabdus amylolytica]|uniref:DUF7389 domain-containing protein n=1 Tax=Halorhabdus amylolytica TaxID=2559573 RepID=UPI0010A9A97F|nr:hypothetical protein [Halorhabdus amylolytica]
MSDDVYEYTVKLKRGDGHDVQKCKVTADTIEELDRRVENVREKLADWATEYRAIQPRERPLADDQQRFEEVGEA